MTCPSRTFQVELSGGRRTICPRRLTLTTSAEDDLQLARLLVGLRGRTVRVVAIERTAGPPLPASPRPLPIPLRWRGRSG